MVDKEAASSNEPPKWKKKLSTEYIKPHHVMPCIDASPAQTFQILNFTFPPRNPPALSTVR